MSNIYISSPVHPDVVARAKELGSVFCGYGDEVIKYDDIKSHVDAALLRSGTFTGEMMASSPLLRIIARHGVGIDTVDIQAATKCGIWVTNTPGGNSRSVAEHVFALILSVARKIGAASEQTRNGVWAEHRVQLNGIELEGRTLGLLGQGNIGTIVAKIARGFGMRVLVTDPALDQEFEGVVSYDQLLRSSDILSLHLPLNPSTKNIVDAEAIAKMKTGAILINTARGGLVDEDALADALRTGRLGGAGLDVLDAENTDIVSPMPHNRLPIKELPNLIVTPHIGAQTDESLLRVGLAALDDIHRVLSGNKHSTP